MATYVIGDLQGCFEPLTRLLSHIAFSPAHDQLWFCGDLLARGPDSLACLNFVKGLGSGARVVLGNHDLNFIASYYGFTKLKPNDNLQQLQQAPNVSELVTWLCEQPLIHYSSDKNTLMVHAGLAPEWDLATALAAADAVSACLKSQPERLLAVMYGNSPTQWSDATTEAARWRFTINACTRMRFCHADGSLEMTTKTHPSAEQQLIPWYEFWRNKAHPQYCFGHWASLDGFSPVPGIHALDTGCVWGNRLTAYCIETQQRYSVKA